MLVCQCHVRVTGTGQEPGHPAPLVPGLRHSQPCSITNISQFLKYLPYVNVNLMKEFMQENIFDLSNRVIKKQNRKKVGRKLLTLVRHYLIQTLFPKIPKISQLIDVDLLVDYFHIQKRIMSQKMTSISVYVMLLIRGVVGPIIKPYKEWLCHYCAMGKNLYLYYKNLLTFFKFFI